jgi:hypothetical protein
MPDTDIQAGTYSTSACPEKPTKADERNRRNLYTVIYSPYAHPHGPTADAAAAANNI